METVFYFIAELIEGVMCFLVFSFQATTEKEMSVCPL